MIQHRGLYWPDDVGTKYEHALRHAYSLEASLVACKEHRTAVQAGGNIGLWPKRMASTFRRVLTFEPEPLSRACLRKNVPDNVEVFGMALGAETGTCGILRQSLGSHQVIEGDEIVVTTVDAGGLDDLDLLQLDVEGYEWHALMGAQQTVQRCHPVIHIELRGFTEKYRPDRQGGA